jgi:Holliday junction resolvase
MTLHRRNPRRDRNERQLIDGLQKAGAVVHRISGTGLPDLLVGYRKRWILLEVKSPKGKLEPAQVLFHQAAQALGLPCHIVHTFEDCLEHLK